MARGIQIALATVATIGAAAMLANGQPPAPSTVQPTDDVKGAARGKASVRFEAVDVFIESTAMPLAAYQFEFIAPKGATIVGVEGGESAAFAKPPYYDAEALMQGRMIIAAYSLDDELPSGKTRVARLHLRIEGEPDASFTVKMMTAANVHCDRIDVEASTSPAVLDAQP